MLATKCISVLYHHKVESWGPSTQANRVPRKVDRKRMIPLKEPPNPALKRRGRKGFPPKNDIYSETRSRRSSLSEGRPGDRMASCRELKRVPSSGRKVAGCDQPPRLG